VIEKGGGRYTERGYVEQGERGRGENPLRKVLQAIEFKLWGDFPIK
jgi:hypothetical protein